MQPEHLLELADELLESGARRPRRARKLSGLGHTDDAAVIAAAIGVAGRAIKPQHREAARAQLDKLAGVTRTRKGDGAA